MKKQPSEQKTTHDVSTSCEVLWISRQTDDAARAFFANANPTAPAQNIESVIGQLSSAGALWLARGNQYESSRPASGRNYADASNSNSDVVGCTWSKDINTASGQFSIQLKPRVPYDVLLKPSDLLVIFMDNDHLYGRDNRTHGTLITFGIIDSISKSTTVSGDGATIESVSVTGRDLGAIFEETQTVFDKAFAVIDQAFFEAEYITAISETKQSALSPAQNILTLLNLIYNFNATGSKLVGGQWTLPNTTNSVTGRPVTLLSLVNVFSFVQTPIYGYSLPQSSGVVQAGTVWNLLNNFCNRVVNEFFFDVRDFVKEEFDVLTRQSQLTRLKISPDDSADQNSLKREVSESGVFNQSTLEADVESTVSGAPPSPPMPVMAMVLRQRPYDRDAFRLLPTHDLHFTEVYEDSTSRSTHQVVNFFKMAFPDLGPVAWELIFGVKVNLDSVPLVGLRRFEGDTLYSFATSDAGDSYIEGDDIEIFGEVYKYYVGLISTWFAANDLLLYGTISCRFRPEIRVGSRLRHKRLDGKVISYYVENVNHSFGVSPGSSNSSFTVVRGYEEGRKDLPNNLIWTENGSGIPADAVRWGVTVPGEGMEDSSDQDERTISDHERFVEEFNKNNADPDIEFNQ